VCVPLFCFVLSDPLFRRDRSLEGELIESFYLHCKKSAGLRGAMQKDRQKTGKTHRRNEGRKEGSKTDRQTDRDCSCIRRKIFSFFLSFFLSVRRSVCLFCKKKEEIEKERDKWSAALVLDLTSSPTSLPSSLHHGTERPKKKEVKPGGQQRKRAGVTLTSHRMLWFLSFFVCVCAVTDCRHAGFQFLFLVKLFFSQRECLRSRELLFFPSCTLMFLRSTMHAQVD